jgi:2-polyprenyl-6-methoxyphenol hydroxylase-like FAD-dependent oxidoreductase
LRRALAPTTTTFDEMAQVRMPHWSAGRVALLGDAAFGPSPMSGQGTSLALIGAHLLAHQVDTAPDVATAFNQWENGFRAHVVQTQRLAGDRLSVLLPGSRRGIGLRNQSMRGHAGAGPAGRRLHRPDRTGVAVGHPAGLELPTTSTCPRACVIAGDTPRNVSISCTFAARGRTCES